MVAVEPTTIMTFGRHVVMMRDMVAAAVGKELGTAPVR